MPAAGAPSKDPSPGEIAGMLNQLLDDESTGQYMYWIPVSHGVKIGMSDPQFIIPTIVAVCRQILKRLLEGRSHAEVQQYLVDTIGYDDRNARMAISQTRHCAGVGARLINGEFNEPQAVAELLTGKNADLRAVTAMLTMTQDVIKECGGRFTADDLAKLDDSLPPGPLADFFWLVPAISLAAWPALWFGLGFKWWSSMLCAAGLLFLGTYVFAVIELKLQRMQDSRKS
jgi:hypothetical protein